MTKAKVSSEASTFIKVSWSPPKWRPFLFQLITSCRFSCQSQPYLSSDIHILANMRSSTVSNLHAGSVCEMTLFAFYNPASIDPGIILSAKTKSESKVTLSRSSSKSAKKEHNDFCRCFDHIAPVFIKALVQSG